MNSLHWVVVDFVNGYWHWQEDHRHLHRLIDEKKNRLPCLTMKIPSIHYLHHEMPMLLTQVGEIQHVECKLKKTPKE